MLYQKFYIYPKQIHFNKKSIFFNKYRKQTFLKISYIRTKYKISKILFYLPKTDISKNCFIHVYPVTVLRAVVSQ